MRFVADSSPLIALAKLGMLSLLGEEVVIPRAVFAEVIESNRRRNTLMSWLRGVAIKYVKYGIGKQSNIWH